MSGSVTPTERAPAFPPVEPHLPPVAPESSLRGRGEPLHVPAAPPVGAPAAAAEQAHIERFDAVVARVTERPGFDAVRNGADLNALYNAMFTGENKTRFERDLNETEKKAVSLRWNTALVNWINAHKPEEAPQGAASSVSEDDAPAAPVAPRTAESFARDVEALPTAMQQQVVYILAHNYGEWALSGDAGYAVLAEFEPANLLAELHTHKLAVLQNAVKGILRNNTAFLGVSVEFIRFVRNEFDLIIIDANAANARAGDAVATARFTGHVESHRATLDAARASFAAVLTNVDSTDQQKKEAMVALKRAYLTYVSFAYAHQPRAAAPAAPPAAPVKVDLLYAFDLDRQADSIRHNRQKTRDMFRPLEETMLGGMFTAPVRFVWAVACAVQAATLAVFYRVRALFDRGETQVQTRAILSFKADVQVELLTNALKDAGLALLFAFPILGGISAIFYYKRQDRTPPTRVVQAFQSPALPEMRFPQPPPAWDVSSFTRFAPPPPPPPELAFPRHFSGNTGESRAPWGAPTAHHHAGHSAPPATWGDLLQSPPPPRPLAQPGWGEGWSADGDRSAAAAARAAPAQ